MQENACCIPLLHFTPCGGRCYACGWLPPKCALTHVALHLLVAAAEHVKAGRLMGMWTKPPTVAANSHHNARSALPSVDELQAKLPGIVGARLFD